MIRRAFAAGYAASVPAEQVYVAGRHPWAGRPPLILCHGATDNAASIATVAGFNALVTALAADHLVVAADLAGNAFGNATSDARITDAITYARSLGAVGKPRLIGISMGAAAALNYARPRASEVVAVAGIIPALDLADLKTNRGMGALIDAAYPPAYDDATHGPTRSPVRYAAELAQILPVCLWTASNDPYAVPATADAFVNARPQTGRISVGALGHTPAAVAAAAPQIAAWLTT